MKDSHKVSLIVLTFVFSFLNWSYADELDKKPNYASMMGATPSGRLTYHEPNYFLAGEDDFKIQFSAKYQLINRLDLYFAYTQQMFWDFYDRSKPFRDIIYMPEVFYRTPFLTDILRSVDIGYLHNSNGENSVRSRSFDRIYLQLNLYRKKVEGINIYSNLRFYDIFNEEFTNRDIDNHLGWWKLNIIAANIIDNGRQRLDFQFSVFAGDGGFKFDEGGNEIGLMFTTGFKWFNPLIYVQRYHGYAETLLDYDQKVERYRAGLIIYI